MEEKFGTEYIEKTFDVLIEIGEGLERRLADDDKISIPEAISLAVDVFPDIYQVGKNAKALVLEYKDWSAEEKAAVLEKVAVRFDLENDKVEDTIEAGLILLMSLDTFLSKFRKEDPA